MSDKRKATAKNCIESLHQTSVRYIADPAMHKSAAAAAAAQRKKKDSLMSDYEGPDQIVLTDMTTVPAETTAGSAVTGGSGVGFRRNSRTSHVPGWRQSSRGDNPDGAVLKPICTKDLVCWAYQGL